MTLGHPNAFARQFDFWNSQYPWRRVPMYILAQLAGAVLAPLLLRALLGGTAMRA